MNRNPEMSQLKVATIVSVLIGASAAMLIGCAAYIPASYVKPGPNPVLAYQFDYTPKESSKLKDPLTFLLISPQYDVNFPIEYRDSQGGWYNRKLSGATRESLENLKRVVDTYSTSMGDDFREMMTEKGFHLTQMVKEQQRATYSQREQSHFSLTPKIVVEISDQRTSVSKPSQDAKQALVTNAYSPGKVAGQFGVKARIVLEVYEPLTWQLLWVKSLETEALTQEYTYKWNYIGTGDSTYVVGEDYRPQALASLLQKSYNKVMGELDTYLDPNEFLALDQQVKMIRQKAAGEVK